MNRGVLLGPVNIRCRLTRTKKIESNCSCYCRFRKKKNENEERKKNSPNYSDYEKRIWKEKKIMLKLIGNDEKIINHLVETLPSHTIRNWPVIFLKISYTKELNRTNGYNPFTTTTWFAHKMFRWLSVI